MKSTLSFSFLLCLLLQGCVFDQLNGDGKVETQHRNVAAFEGVETASGIDVFLAQGAYLEVKVEADANLHDHIHTDVKNGILHIHTDGQNIGRAKKKQVHVTMPDIRYIGASSAGDVVATGPIKSRALEVRGSSAGDVKLEVYADSLWLVASSSGNIDISGKATYVNANASSAGDIAAKKLHAEHAVLHSSSAGDIVIHVNQTLDASASSAGDISYTGNPEVLRTASSSSGDIRHK